MATNQFGGLISTYAGSQATVAKNILISIDGTHIAEVEDTGVPVPLMDTAEIDVTNQDSGIYKEWKPGRRNGRDATMTGNYVATDPGQQALYNASINQTINLYTILFPNGASWSYYGLLKSFTTEVKKDLIQFTAVVKITGPPTLSTLVVPMAATPIVFTPVATTIPALTTGTTSGGTYVATFAAGGGTHPITSIVASSTVPNCTLTVTCSLFTNQTGVVNNSLTVAFTGSSSPYTATLNSGSTPVLPQTALVLATSSVVNLAVMISCATYSPAIYYFSMYSLT